MKIRTCAVAVAALLLGPTAAFADAGNPNYRSTVTAVRPAVKGLSVTVLDYDDRLQIHNQSGRTVMVEDYQGKPYLRFGADGSVEVNTNSEAYYLNDDRFGDVPVPKGLGSQPHWKVAVQDGSLRLARPPDPLDEQDGSATAEEQERPDAHLRLAGPDSGRLAAGCRLRLAELGAAAQHAAGRSDLGPRRSHRRRNRGRAAHAPSPEPHGGHAAAGGGGMVIHRLRLAVALALAGCAVLPATASAHATLEGTVPEAAAQLARPPAQVVFRFDETVDASLGAVKVFDSSGRQVQVGSAFHPGGRGSEVAARLPRTLPQGGYTATYHVISADSHPVSGGFTFNIGRGGRAGLAVANLLKGQSSGAVTGTAFSTARAVQYGAIAVGVGSLIFLFVCWLPGLTAAAGGGEEWRAASLAFAARMRVLLGVAAAAGVLSGGRGDPARGGRGGGHVGVVGRAWRRHRQRAGHPLRRDLAGGHHRVAAARRHGRSASDGAAGAAAGGGRGHWSRAASARPAPRPLALPAGILVFLPALAGHTSVQSPVALLLPADVLHVLAMSAWLGGIVVLVLALRSATARLEQADRSRLLLAVIGRFSRLALAAFAVFVVTGAAMAIVQVASLSALSTTAFGRAVLYKVLLFLVLLGFGYVNRNRLLPALRQADGSPGHAGVLLRRTLQAELGVGVAILAVTGALAGYAPSTVVAKGPVSREADVGPAHLQATLDPARVGANQLHLYLFDRRSGAQFTRPRRSTSRQRYRARASRH